MAKVSQTVRLRAQAAAPLCASEGLVCHGADAVRQAARNLAERALGLEAISAGVGFKGRLFAWENDGWHRDCCCGA